jgi:nicotinamidase-related amidase
LPIDLRPLLTPTRSALVINECQEGVIGSESEFPQLAEAIGGMVTTIDRLARAARSVGVPVLHTVVDRRLDGRGTQHNLPGSSAANAKPQFRGDEFSRVYEAILVEDDDFVLTRWSGTSPFVGNGLALLLRNLDVFNVLFVGVSLNVAILNAVFDATNEGFRAIVVQDAVAGIPPEYAQSVLANTVSVVAVRAKAADVIAHWEHGARSESSANLSSLHPLEPGSEVRDDARP